MILLYSQCKKQHCSEKFPSMCEKLLIIYHRLYNSLCSVVNLTNYVLTKQLNYAPYTQIFSLCGF